MNSLDIREVLENGGYRLDPERLVCREFEPIAFGRQTVLVTEGGRFFVEIGRGTVDERRRELVSRIAAGEACGVLPDWPLNVRISPQAERMLGGTAADAPPHPLADQAFEARGTSMTGVLSFNRPIYALWLPAGGVDGEGKAVGSWLVELTGDTDHPAVFFERSLAEQASADGRAAGLDCYVVELRAVPPVLPVRP